MQIDELKQIVNQGTLNYYSKDAEVICSFVDYATCGVDLYINKELRDTITISHNDPKVLRDLIKHSVETLKDRIY